METLIAKFMELPGEDKWHFFYLACILILIRSVYKQWQRAVTAENEAKRCTERYHIIHKQLIALIDNWGLEVWKLF